MVGRIEGEEGEGTEDAVDDGVPIAGHAGGASVGVRLKLS